MEYFGLYLCHAVSASITEIFGTLEMPGFFGYPPDVTGDAHKFNNLHLRLVTDGDAPGIYYHYDSFNIVQYPLSHILFDTLYQGFRFLNW